jgi:hypothetical protein
MSRPLLLDDALPPVLAAELARRGRPSEHVRDVGLAGADDAALLAAAAERGAVLVTTEDRLPAGAAAVAVVGARDDAGRREVVHRWAHEMAAQGAGRTRRYR